MENFKLVTRLNILPAVEELVKHPKLWDEHTLRQEFEGSPHKDTKSIYLRWCADQSVAAAFEDNPTHPYPAWWHLQNCRGLTHALADAVGATHLGRVMLVALRKNGGCIDRHVDEGAYADRYERFHLPLLTDDGCQFYSETSPGCGEFVNMHRGEVWWFNHKRPHWVYNGSPFHRVHLIVDCVAPAYRVERDLCLSNERNAPMPNMPNINSQRSPDSDGGAGTTT